ncbi:uncharacterized protein F5147DRAFT_572464, partial [Suillus discolor]
YLSATQGLSKMKRNHIHLAQGIPGDNVMSGMRNSLQIVIFVDLQKALQVDAGVLFYLSTNGVLTGGNEGFLSPTYFQRVEFAIQSLLSVQDLQAAQSDPSTSASI